MTVRHFFSALLLALTAGVFTGCGASREHIAAEFDIASKRLDTGVGSLIRGVSSTHRDYQFLLDAGGILVQAPVKEANGTYFLPVRADVSGASNITRQPVAYHAKIAVADLVFTPDEKDASRMYLYIETGWPTKEAPSPVTRGKNIGKLAPGKYTLEYLNRDGSTVMLGGFTI